ncbi:MAG TPA: pyridoxamine 5'-phosphate oxidase [Longimicrobiales bacterium]|nr:pyridoxamine 5'-phosphate oxidase [Longimicrobiales bacterium]
MGLLSRLRLLLTFGKGVLRGVSEASESRDPLDLFGEWWDAARRSGLYLPETMALATATLDGAPSVRMVLLKAVDERGFVFYTNYGSRKARELEANPRAAMCFHWAVLERQVRVSGSVARISHDESAAYFRTRARGSRIGAWASRQSDTLPDRPTLEERFRRCRAEFEGGEVPLPPFWGGYRLVPDRLEFWQGRADRLHDRVVFERDGYGAPWVARRLYP